MTSSASRSPWRLCHLLAVLELSILLFSASHTPFQGIATAFIQLPPTNVSGANSGTYQRHHHQQQQQQQQDRTARTSRLPLQHQHQLQRQRLLTSSSSTSSSPRRLFAFLHYNGHDDLSRSVGSGDDSLSSSSVTDGIRAGSKKRVKRRHEQQRYRAARSMLSPSSSSSSSSLVIRHATTAAADGVVDKKEKQDDKLKLKLQLQSLLREGIETRQVPAEELLAALEVLETQAKEEDCIVDMADVEGDWLLVYSSMLKSGYMPVDEIISFYPSSNRMEINTTAFNGLIPLGGIRGTCSWVSENNKLDWLVDHIKIGPFKINKNDPAKFYTFFAIEGEGNASSSCGGDGGGGGGGNTIIAARSSAGSFTLMKRV